VRKIALINPPFAAVRRPSIALAQLQSVARGEFGIAADTFYLNLAVARQIGLELYDEIAEGWHYMRGLGDWLFRGIAYPEIPDNAEEYLARMYPEQGDIVADFKKKASALRPVIYETVTSYIEQHDIAGYDVVGLTSMFSQNMASFAVARLVKERNPAATVIMGGANCENPMGSAIAASVKWLDYVFSGPAINSFRHFLRYSPPAEPSSVPPIQGVLGRGAWPGPSLPVITGPVITGGAAAEVGSRNDINEPIDLDYDGYLDALDRHFPGGSVAASLPFETSRGCWWGERSHCTFCGLNGTGMKFDAMTPERAASHISALFRYAGRARMLEAVDNILPRAFVSEVLPLLRTPPGMSVFFEIKVGLTDRDLITLARAGVDEVQPGIESLATSTLRLMRKGSTAFQNIMLLRSMRAIGIKPHWLLLVGFPGEPDAVYRKYLRDLPLLTHLQPPGSVFPVRFDRYSVYFEERDRYGLDLRPMDFYELVYPFEPPVLENLAYYFEDHDARAGYVQACRRYLKPLRAIIAQWRALWDDPDGGRPQLTLIEHSRSADGAVILDSRAGRPAFRAVSGAGLALLDVLRRPLDLAHAARRAGLAHGTAREEMLRLQADGLVFEERGKYLSLIVCPLEPVPETPAYPAGPAAAYNPIPTAGMANARGRPLR
jgi:magnesium-protoporphyrin IX monomethyl ester (oxidative) cyclase